MGGSPFSFPFGQARGLMLITTCDLSIIMRPFVFSLQPCNDCNVYTRATVLTTMPHNQAFCGAAANGVVSSSSTCQRSKPNLMPLTASLTELPSGWTVILFLVNVSLALARWRQGFVKTKSPVNAALTLGAHFAARNLGRGRCRDVGRSRTAKTHETSAINYRVPQSNGLRMPCNPLERTRAARVAISPSASAFASRIKRPLAAETTEVALSFHWSATPPTVTFLVP